MLMVSFETTLTSSWLSPCTSLIKTVYAYNLAMLTSAHVFYSLKLKVGKGFVLYSI